MIKQLYMQKVSCRAASVTLHRTGFTLVEIMIVVIILGILAAIVLPAFSNANIEAKEAMLKEDVRIMRTQIGTYMVQHNDIPPGYPVGGGAPTEADFIAQMTKYTNENGATSDTKTDEYSFGPYMKEMSVNSVNNLSAIAIVADGDNMPANPPDDVGWVYKPETLTWRAGNTGKDLSGRSYYGY